jgi:hypothetical protein
VVLKVEEDPFIGCCSLAERFDGLGAAALLDNDDPASDTGLAERTVDGTQRVGKALERQD